jgi:hypothetical protein
MLNKRERRKLTIHFPGRRCTSLLTALLLFLVTVPSSAQNTETVIPESGKHRADLLPLIAIGTGILLFEAGGIAGHIAFELQQEACDYWERYVRGGAQIEDLLVAYKWRYLGYTSFELASYLLWSGGASILSLSAFKFPESAYTLSPEGKYFLAVGLSLSMLGNAFAFNAGIQALENRRLWESYLKTGGFSQIQEDAYDQGYRTYIGSKIASYGFWAMGGAAAAGSFFIPGANKTPVITSFMDRLLISAGTGMISGGNIFYSAALNAKAQAEEAWDRYLAAGGIQEELLDLYKKQYTRYQVSAYLAYGLWLGGGASVLTAVYGSFGNSASKASDRPVRLSIYPLPSGLGAGLTYRY